MRVGIATVHTPGIHGGAEFLVDGLVDAVSAAGHQVHKISLPFFFEPIEVAGKTMDQCQALDFMPFAGGSLDRLICLKFPAYMIPHPDKRVWLLHQHRAAYDLYGTPYGWPKGKAATDALRARIIKADLESLGADAQGNSKPGSAKAVFTIAKRVSARLQDYSGIASTPLYHPPADADDFRCDETLPYIFVPSRLEGLKRQDLFLQALAACKTPIKAIIAGDGSMRSHLEAMSERLGLADQVRFAGAVSRAHMLSLYANATAVFFGPLDEDYGYVTLEAMLSKKPVITCTDSGGPLEFVVAGQTGAICDPDPGSIALALEKIGTNSSLARDMGQAGFARYQAMNISWDHAAEALLSDSVQASTVKTGAPS